MQTPRVLCSNCFVLLCIVLSCVVLGTPSMIEITGEAKLGSTSLIRLDYKIGLYRVCMDMSGIVGMSGCDIMDDDCRVKTDDGKALKLSSDSCNVLKPIRTWFDVSFALGVVTLICAWISACTLSCSLYFAIIISILAGISCAIATGYAVSLKSKDQNQSVVDASISMESKYAYGFAFLVINTILYFAIAISLSRARRKAQAQNQNNYMPLQAMIITTHTQPQQPAIVQQQYNINNSTNNNQQYHFNQSYPSYPSYPQPTQPPAYVPPEPRVSDTASDATNVGTIN